MKADDGSPMGRTTSRIDRASTMPDKHTNTRRPRLSSDAVNRGSPWNSPVTAIRIQSMMEVVFRAWWKHSFQCKVVRKTLSDPLMRIGLPEEPAAKRQGDILRVTQSTKAATRNPMKERTKWRYNKMTQKRCFAALHGLALRTKESRRTLQNAGEIMRTRMRKRAAFVKLKKLWTELQRRQRQGRLIARVAMRFKHRHASKALRQ